MDTKYVKVPIEVLQGVVNYLETRPFKEVAVLLQQIMQENKPVEAVEKEE